MKIVGDHVTNLIKTVFDLSRFYYVGHSLGGHLEPWINIRKDGVALIGTPPLSCSNDFVNAFKPDEKAKELLPLLSKKDRFTLQETVKFVLYIGMIGEFLEDMLVIMDEVDGKVLFRMFEHTR
jgi:hypothetical protein